MLYEPFTQTSTARDTCTRVSRADISSTCTSDLSSWQMAEDEAELVLEPDEASAEVSKKKKKKKKKTSASAETAEGEEPAAAPPAQVQPAPDAQE
eukprot:4212051-Prymnesium_polylepis.1